MTQCTVLTSVSEKQRRIGRICEPGHSQLPPIRNSLHAISVGFGHFSWATMESVMLRSVLLIILFAFSASVYADGFSYNSVTVSYGQIDFDNLNADGDSLGIGASAEIGESFFVFGGYGVADIGDSVVSVDVDSWDVGIGYHMPISDSVDFVSSLSYEYVDISAPGLGSVDDNGIGLGVGLRYAANERFEINAGISYVDFSDGGDDTTFSAGFLYNFTESFSVGVGGDWGDFSTAYSIGGRFYFGN